MSDFQGTEGKWTVIDGSASGKQVVSESAPKVRRNIASCGGQRREQNANLIAAAPELLEALRGVMSMFPVIEDDASGRAGFTAEARDKLNAARAAIAKALGQ